MKILYLGEISVGQTALMRMRALERLGHVVRGVNTNTPWKKTSWVARQVQRRLERGPTVDRVNSSVLSEAREFRPNLVWADKQQFLRRETLEELRKLGARLVHFTPDPYFTQSGKRTRLMDEAVWGFDCHVYCKSYERAAYEALGLLLVYMPLGYCDEVHRPLPSADANWSCSVGFLGGWEPHREKMLHEIAKIGIDLKFRGAYWNFLQDGQWTLRRYFSLRQLVAPGEPVQIHQDDILGPLWQGDEIYGDDYARALTGAGIGLGFLRRTWPDQHTTRTFEIPACGSMLLADRTQEHQEFFKEGHEAEFVGSTEELLDKVKYYCNNETARKRVAEAGRLRCIDGRYAYIHRMQAAIEAINDN